MRRVIHLENKVRYKSLGISQRKMKLKNTLKLYISADTHTCIPIQACVCVSVSHSNIGAF